MKTALIVSVLLALGAEAFQPATLRSTRTTKLVVHGYIPDGFTAKSYAKFKAEEKKKQEKKKNLGALGPKGFQSRSFQSFQEALERGEAAHLMPVFNAKEKVAKGEIKMEDIPDMQRGGNWDNSDVKGARKKKWLSSDKVYAAGGYKKEQSYSIFGGEPLDWTGRKGRTGPSESVRAAAPKFGRNYKPPNVYDMKGTNAPKKPIQAAKKDDDKPKKFFGL
eukprot:CAMPEP_0116833826 /NCGR_PEP_ID=MMETSP0418-20121206/6655_1 /TAXON_ID=1158023 /ORGANISM="Astrosyne radiata, Strain 13vi08-1A" /LENGTH=219 /DNA_ID=CAMNT_0004463325 /DNA_START=52 /DNA_END=708 /DNA_ORIENTATION=-